MSARTVFRDAEATAVAALGVAATPVVRLDVVDGVASCECGWSGVPTRDGCCPRCVEVPVTEALWQLELAERRVHEQLNPQPRVFVQREGVARVERNAPCPCGSGRKAKKCCHA